MRMRWALALIWGCFLARLAFYSAIEPLWEGYDEWAHFAVIRTMLANGEALVSRDAPIPRDVEASLELAPVPYEMRYLPPPSVTHEAWWRLPAGERARRQAEYRAMPVQWRAEAGLGPLKAYEALQPPLYYWLMTPAAALAANASLGAQVVLLRWFGALIASAAIPLIFRIARLVFGEDAPALGCAAAAALMPGLAVDLARVGNECVAVVLYALLIWAGLKTEREGIRPAAALRLGAILGFGLLAKAYFLTALPAVALLLAWHFRNARGRRARVTLCALIVAAASFAIAGWWYIRNLVSTGTLSGLSESVMLRHTSLPATLARLGEVNWVKAIDSVLLSHFYFGGWSSLTARAWMYHLLYALALAAAIGLARLLRRPEILWLAAVYAFFWAGQLYNVWMLYLTKGVATSMGWYLYAVLGAEATLAVAGLRALLPASLRRWAAPAAATLFALLDLYTVHALAIPYYTGMVVRKANGGIAGLHAAQLREYPAAFARLAAFKEGIVSPGLVVTLWAAYAAATLAILYLCFRRSATPEGNTPGASPS
jgi:hypothetical protein